MSKRQVERSRSTLLESKFAAPFARPGLVERTDVLDRLAAETAPTVVSVVAPAGYGKSTLLRQWTARNGRPHAWLTLDADDNDPVVLLTYLAAALDRLEPVDPELFRLLDVEHPSVRSVARMLGAAITAWPHPAVLVLDDVHVLENHSSQDVVALLVEHVSAGSQVALASRSALRLPVARLRAEGRITEVGPDDLALDLFAASAALEGAGVELPPSDVATLVDASEGWPVAIYLTARSIKASGRRGTLDLARLGQSRNIAAYAHAELLSALPQRSVQFLTRSSVLDRMSGPLCDAVLRTFGSAVRLEQMAQSNLLVTPLDEHRSWYRYHHLFRDLLRAELELREPALVPELNRRAGEWCQANGLPDAAVEYAMAADDVDRAAELVQQRTLHLYRSGRAVTLGRWFDWFDATGRISHHPGVAAAGVWVAALTGRAAAAERWAGAAEAAQPGQGATDGSARLRGQVALMRVLLCRDGMDAALVDAGIAERLVPVDDAWRATTLVLLGMVRLFTGSRDDADTTFLHAVEIGREIGATAATSVGLAQRAVVALERGEQRQARALATAACTVVDDHRLQDHVTNVFVFAVAARMAIHDGDVARAEQLMMRAQGLRPRLTYALPHFAVQARLELIRAMLSLADVSGARTLLREVDDILRLRPFLGVLTEQRAELLAQTVATPIGSGGASSLTAAELRLMPLLQTHLTFREIGERLFVSPHTVKTQAISIYRKLGVSSRGDAMRRASEVGLLPG